MGENINTSGNSVDGEPTKRKCQRNTAPTSTTENGGNTDTSTRGTTTTGETETKKEPLEISILGNTGDTVKKTRTKKTKSAEPPIINATMISGLIGALSTIVASRPNMEIWKLSDEEIKSVAEPLANIIQKSEQLSKIAEHTDAIALTIAVTTIAVPRVMYMSNQAKQKKEVLKNGQKRKIATSDTRDGDQSEPDSQSNDNPLSSYNATE